MGDARKFAFRAASAVVTFVLCGLVQPAAAQFRDNVAFTITNAAGETAVPPGCPSSSSLNPFRLTRGSLPASDYSCLTGEADVRGVAAYYAPYAVQAALAYEQVNGRAWLNGAMKKAFGTGSERVKDLLRQRRWHFRYADRCLTLGLCRSRYSVDSKGLAYHIWSRGGLGACSEAAIAFRGSVGSVNAWGANLQDFIPAWSSEYDQLRLELPAILAKVQERLRCRQIVAVGHSLGGGLGQFAALDADPETRIAKVVTFNASPVSGEDRFDANSQQRLAANKQGLTIDRVNQQGEVLSYNYFKERRQTKASECNPLIRGVEFNAGASGSGIPLMSAYEQHKMVPFASRLVALSYTNDANSSLVAPRLPPAGKVPCGGLRYREQEQELIATAGPNDRQGAVNAGPMAGQQSQDVAVYPSAPAPENALARFGGATLHKRVARQHGHRSAKIHLARS